MMKNKTVKELISEYEELMGKAKSYSEEINKLVDAHNEIRIEAEALGKKVIDGWKVESDGTLEGCKLLISNKENWAGGKKRISSENGLFYRRGSFDRLDKNKVFVIIDGKQMTVDCEEESEINNIENLSFKKCFSSDYIPMDENGKGKVIYFSDENIAKEYLSKRASFIQEFLRNEADKIGKEAITLP